MQESTLMVTEAIVAPFYAPIGDKYGRRPVILTLVVFWGFFAIGFGLVKSLFLAIVLRGCRMSHLTSFTRCFVRWQKLTGDQLGCWLVLVF